MSQVENCPTCGGKSKVKELDDNTTYEAIQNEELIKKVEQLKKALQKYKDKLERLEEQLRA